MARLAVVVTTPPHSNLTTTAIDYVRSALVDGVNVIGIFFYQDGVLNASKELSLPSDEYQAISQWSSLHSEYNLALHVCVSAAEKRGLTDELTDNNSETNIHPAFTLSGLGFSVII